MDNTTRFKIYTNSLKQFYEREGHCRVPAIHVEIFEGNEVNLGAWVGYTRQRYKKKELPINRIEAISSIPGWEWGPLKPGPATDIRRNSEIFEMRRSGLSLRQIADKFDLSRQRIHQIVKTDINA